MQWVIGLEVETASKRENLRVSHHHTRLSGLTAHTSNGDERSWATVTMCGPNNETRLLRSAAETPKAGKVLVEKSYKEGDWERTAIAPRTESRCDQPPMIGQPAGRIHRHQHLQQLLTKGALLFGVVELDFCVCFLRWVGHLTIKHHLDKGGEALLP